MHTIVENIVGQNSVLNNQYHCIEKLWPQCKTIGHDSIFSTYIRATIYLCFTFWLRNDELIVLQMCSIKFE